MIKRAARIDDNHREIVRALRAVGATVHDTSTLGGGFPDLAVGYRGINFLLEIKDGAKTPSRQRLTKDQQNFFTLWRGTASIVTNELEALHAIGAI
jgi:hypothetical protein